MLGALLFIVCLLASSTVHTLPENGPDVSIKSGINKLELVIAQMHQEHARIIEALNEFKQLRSSGYRWILRFFSDNYQQRVRAILDACPHACSQATKKIDYLIHLMEQVELDPQMTNEDNERFENCKQSLYQLKDDVHTTINSFATAMHEEQIIINRCFYGALISSGALFMAALITMLKIKGTFEPPHTFLYPLT